jgi:hypothetical protein
MAGVAAVWSTTLLRKARSSPANAPRAKKNAAIRGCFKMLETEHFRAVGMMLQCSHCPAETRTERGMLLHLAVCHGLRLASSLADEAATATSSGDLPHTVRE